MRESSYFANTQEKQGIWVFQGLGLSAILLVSFAASAGDGQFFTLTKDKSGRYWFQSPEQKRFFSRGVNFVTSWGDFAPKENRFPYRESILNRYGSVEAWAEVTSSRLQKMGWNTIGAWSEHELFSSAPYTPIMACSHDFNGGKISNQDFWSADFENHANKKAELVTKGRVSDPNLIGYFIDNELPWGRDHRDRRDLMIMYFAFGRDSAGKQKLVAMLKERHKTIETLNAKWGTVFRSFDEILDTRELSKNTWRKATEDQSEFLYITAQRYYQVCSKALRNLDSNHLLLGSRFVSILTWPEVLRAAGETQDVISVNNYEFMKGIPKAVSHVFGKKPVSAAGWLEQFHRITGKPILIGEFGYRAFQKETPGLFPPLFVPLFSQKARAERFERYLEKAFSKPWIVGYHVFQWMDQPKSGRFDGENNNWGLVDIEDQEYSVVSDVISRVHSEQNASLVRASN